MPRIPLAVLLLALAAPGARVAAQQGEATTLVTGLVTDTLTGRPLRLAVVRVAETGASTLTDESGRYQIVVARGPVRLEVRRIGYEPASVTLQAAGHWMRNHVYLRPLAIGLTPVTVTARDEFARGLIQRAIARKHEVYAGIHDYRYDAYVKFVVRDLVRHADSAASVVLITETRTSAYWEQPDHYQETILARRQSNNLSAERNLVSVGEIVNFSRDRIDLQKYSVVSPIADDALDHYDYRVLDTLAFDERRVFRLAIQPGSEGSPLFAGMIDIADSSYDVLRIDVGVNGAVRFNMLKNLRYQQRLKDVGGGRWMPYEIRFTGDVSVGIPLPGFPEHMTFEHVAALNQFRFDERNRPPNLGELRILVHDGADRADSATWTASGAIPLTTAERAAWARIDSVASQPPDLGDWVRQGLGLAVKLSTDPMFFHFNRVDGTYLGVGNTWWQIPGLVLRTKLGYASGSDTWRYRFGATVRVSDARRLWVGGSVRDVTASRPTLVSRDYNPTYRALLWRLDPLDYYREHGFVLTLDTKVVDFTDFELHYNDLRQSSLGMVTDYSVFSVDRLQRPNPAIVDGRLRSLSASFTYDSRPLLRSKGEDYYLQRLTSTRIRVNAEVASPGLIVDDFDFQRYSLQLERRQRTFNLGLTTITAAGGVATGRVPPQRYFTVDFGMKALTFQGGGFNTVHDQDFTGTRAVMLTLRHDFDRLLFAKSGLPLVRSVPFTLSVHGGVFWTDFVGHQPNPGDSLLVAAPRAYSEVGFGLGNLTPFLSPFNLAAHFTWQLSSYPTSRFTFALSVMRP